MIASVSRGIGYRDVRDPVALHVPAFADVWPDSSRRRAISAASVRCSCTARAAASALFARIASTDYIHTRLTHFERAYDYSGYLRAVNNYRPGVPADTDYIIIDTGHHYSEIRSIDQVRELRDEPEEWEVIPNDSNGLFIVLKRKRRAVAKPALRDGSDPETAQLQ